MFRILELFQYSSCLLCINLIVVIISTFMGWIPAILRFVIRSLRWILVQSNDIYQQILETFAPISFEVFGIDINSGFPRVMACILFSISIIGILGFLLEINISWFLLGVATLHGLIVGLGWIDLDNLEGLFLGSRLR